MKKLLFIFLLLTFSLCVFSSENQSITVKDLFFMKKENTITDNNLVMAHNTEQSEQDNYANKQQEQLYRDFLEAVQTKQNTKSSIEMIVIIFVIGALAYIFWGLFLGEYALFPIAPFFFNERQGSVEYFKIKNRILTATQSKNGKLNDISFNWANYIIFNDRILWKFNRTESLVLKSIYDKKMKEFQVITNLAEKEEYESLYKQL